DLDEEIRSYIELTAAEKVRSGMNPEEARREARKELGGIEQVKESVRDSRTGIFVDTLLKDVRFAIRGLRRTPTFTLIAIATLAIGIGASTAIFSVVDPVLFRSLPYPHADRLVSVGINGSIFPAAVNEFLLGQFYMEWRRQQTPFRSITSMRPESECDLGEQNPVRVPCASVESNFLATFGISPLIGRDFTYEDNRLGAPRVALLSYALWRARFGGDPNVIGRVIALRDQPARIIGVLPRGFEMPQLGAADVLMAQQLELHYPSHFTFLRCFATLREGVSIEQARQQMQPLFKEMLKMVPPALRGEVHLVVRSLRDRQFHKVRLASWLLFGTVLALLLIACSNIANLLLARATARRRELAMRAALGASRARLVRQSLTESLLLGLIGGAAGCGLAWGIVRTLAALAPDPLLQIHPASIDLRVLIFALLISITSAVLFGLAPALERPRPQALAGWHSAGREREIFRQSLLALQIAISLVLLTGASLFARSLLRMENQPTGMLPEHVVTASFVLGVHQYPTAASVDGLYREIESRLRSIPGVRVFALTDSVPPAGRFHGRPYSNIRIAGRPPLPQGGGMVAFRDVTPGYFRALGIRILSGRGFRKADRSSSQDPVILSATLARKMFGKHNPIGQRIALNLAPGAKPVWSPVIGVAADVKNSGLKTAPDPEYYVVRSWNSQGLGHAAVAIFRTLLPTRSLARSIRRRIAAVDPSLPVNIESMPQRIEQLSERPRFVTVLIGLFAAFGLLLAAIGLYGVMSFLVAQRTREIGVRIAVGATNRDILFLVLKFAARWTLLGAALGLIGSLFLTRLARGLLFETSPEDPLSFAAAVLILLLAAFLAAWLPSRRAARIDPAISLRHE
ncbi:MAG: ADOP family duplicated permease, partial [Bryobacteraceae bacterium]